MEAVDAVGGEIIELAVADDERARIDGAAVWRKVAAAMMAAK